MPDNRKPIAPNPPRWKPAADPASIDVPGLDTDASVLEQIEQLEQMITIKLQNIDENFSKIHNVLANKVLPAVKRYAVGTEPVREAAKFWTSFYEQAAQIRIPTYDDHSTVNDLSSDREEISQNQQDASQVSHPQHKDYEPSLVNTESSFFPGQDAFSSTPATARVASTQQSFASQGSSDSLWANPLDSPLVRLGREIQSLDDEDNESLASPSMVNMTSAGQAPNSMSEQSQRQLSTISHSNAKGKAKESSQPLLRNVLRHNLYSASDTSSSDFTSQKPVSPLKFRGKPKTPVPKTFNPYLPPNTDPDKWSGVVDLRDPSVLSTPRHMSGKPHSRHKTAAKESDDDDSFDGLPQGMSPPVLMSPARPPRSSAELGLLKLGQTPTREASVRIARDLVKDAQMRSGQARHLYGYPNSGVESSMSTVPTPPSLSRYNRESSTSISITDSSFDTIVRRVGLNVPRLGSTPGLRLKDKTPLNQQLNEGQQQDDSMLTPLDQEVISASVYDQLHHDIDSDSDSLDEINNTAHPSAAFLMASQGRRGGDDSFGSSNHSSDSLTDEDVDPGVVPVHPFAGGMEDDGFDDDDSFDGFEGNPGGGDFPEETVFGVAPAQRIAAQAAAAAQRHQGGLRMLGEDLLQDTLNIGARVEESPTPAWGGGYRG